MYTVRNQIICAAHRMAPMWILLLGILACANVNVHAEEAHALTFEEDVRPILKAHCFHCHGEDGSTKGRLDVRLRRLLLKGGQHGPAIAPGQAAVVYADDHLLGGGLIAERVDGALPRRLDLAPLVGGVR